MIIPRNFPYAAPKRKVSKNLLTRNRNRKSAERGGCVQKFYYPKSQPKVWSVIFGFMAWILDFGLENFGIGNLDPTPTLWSCVRDRRISPAFPSITICPVFCPHLFSGETNCGRRSQLLVDKTNCANTSKRNTAPLERKKGEI